MYVAFTCQASAHLPSCPPFSQRSALPSRFPSQCFPPSIYLAWPIPSWCLMPRECELTQLFGPFNNVLPPAPGQSVVSEKQRGGHTKGKPHTVKRGHVHSRLYLSPHPCLSAYLASFKPFLLRPLPGQSQAPETLLRRHIWGILSKANPITFECIK